MNIESKLKELISKQDDITHLNETMRFFHPTNPEYELRFGAMRAAQQDRDVIVKAIAKDWNEMVSTLSAVVDLLKQEREGALTRVDFNVCSDAVAASAKLCVEKARVKGE